MAEIHKIDLVGDSGKSYTFSVFFAGTKFVAKAGNYCILKLQNNEYRVIYAGQTGDLSERFADHHKDGCFKRNGETHIAVRLAELASDRLYIERDLIANYTPPCNG